MLAINEKFDCKTYFIHNWNENVKKNTVNKIIFNYMSKWQIPKWIKPWNIICINCQIHKIVDLKKKMEQKTELMMEKNEL